MTTSHKPPQELEDLGRYDRVWIRGLVAEAPDLDGVLLVKIDGAMATNLRGNFKVPVSEVRRSGLTSPQRDLQEGDRVSVDGLGEGEIARPPSVKTGVALIRLDDFSTELQPGEDPVIPVALNLLTKVEPEREPPAKEHDISVRRIEEALIPLCDVLDPEEGPVILAFGVKQLAKRLADNLNGVSVEPEPHICKPLACPDCGHDLQRMPKVGCYYGDGCTHGCGNCGMHWTQTDDDPALKEEQPTAQEPPCDGRCNTVADLGLGHNEGLNPDALAERDPKCSLHGTVAVPEKTLREQLHVVIAKRSSADVADVLADECVVVVAENFDSKSEEIESLFFSKRWFKDEFSAALRAILLSEKREA